LLSGYATQALLEKYELIADTGGAGFVINLCANLMPIWRQFAINLLTGLLYRKYI